MKKLLSIVLLLPLVAFAEKSPADIDKELNSTYQSALKIAVNPKALRDAQRHWLKYADNQCAAAKPHSNEPEFASGWESMCFSELSELRINELKKSFLNHP